MGVEGDVRVDWDGISASEDVRRQRSLGQHDEALGCEVSWHGAEEFFFERIGRGGDSFGRGLL